jgi:hypothetical protein
MALTEQDRRRNVTQTLASQRIEGFEPDAAYLALLERYVRGELTLAQVRAETDKAFSVKKGKAGDSSYSLAA